MLASAIRSFFVCAALLALFGCSTTKTSSDYDPSANFTSYKTYGWLPESPAPTGHPRADNPLLHERIRSSIDRVFKAKGLAFSEDPDILVNYHVFAEQKLDVDTWNSGVYGGGYYGGWGYGWGIPQTTVRQYEEGTLIIDVIDTRAKKVVWRGTGTRRLKQPTGQQDPAELDQRVFESVSETLASFPPQPKA
jgi:hypothetical protein